MTRTLPGRRRTTGAATALAAALALTLTACGSGSDSGPDAGSGAGSEGGTHVVQTAMGDVEVPDDPKRVVVLDTAELDSALTLGVKPVGATNAGTGSGFLGYLEKDRVAGIRHVGTIGTPNLEAVNELKPDLILSSKVRDEKNYENLSKIAPTVLTETTGYPWKANFQVHADALGKKDEARKAVSAYEARVKEVTEALGGPKKAREIETSVVRFIEGADTRVYADKNYIGTLLADVGLGRPEVIKEAEDGFSVDVSPEQITKGDADVLFHATYGDPEKAKKTEITGSGLWKNMKAVKNDKAFEVDDELWIQGIGYTAAGRILDELQAELTQ